MTITATVVASIVATVLAHEAGHFTMARALGYPARLARFGLGTKWGSDDVLSPATDRALVSMAGPLASLLLGRLSGVHRDPPPCCAMSPNPVATAPSESFLRDGVPNGAERAAIKILKRRRNYLIESLEEEDYGGASYDRRELAALSWALALISHLKGGSDDRPRIMS